MRGLFSDKVVISGGFGAIYENLREMAEPQQHKFTYDDMIKAVGLRWKHIKLPQMGSITAYSLDKVRVNPDAFSGHVSSMFSGQTRRQAFHFSNLIAEGMLKRIFKKRINSVDVWRFGCKPKAAKLDHSEKLLKARPIALCDDVLVKIGGFTSQRITEKMKFSGHSELFVGRPLSREDMDWLKATLERNDVFYACPD